MPFRFIPLAPRLQQLFHTGTILRDYKLNHYETLQIPPNASPSEVKKSFYNLSKAHHPDRNPDDRDAANRFVKISEAYAVLGTPAKRQQYDRDVLRSQPWAGNSHAHPGVHPKGSYHSSGPAGGRPASGLSRRRSQFQGPPPSFYRNGGWGTHGAKRQAAQENGAPGAEPPKADWQTGGMGPGQEPLGHMHDVPHFDRDGHFRTHKNYDRRKQQKTSDAAGSSEVNKGTLANFLLVSGIISLAVFIPSILFESRARKHERRK